MSGKRNWGDNMYDRHDGKVPPEPFEVPVHIPSKSWKKKYKCKKNKGDHTFIISTVSGRMHYEGKHEYNGTMMSYTSGNPSPTDTYRGVYIRVNWECSACKKREIETYGRGWFYTSNDRVHRRFDKFRHTMYE